MADKYIVRYLNEDEYEAWDMFVQKHPSGTVFQTSLFLKTVSEALDREFKILGLFNQDDLLGGFAFSVVKKLGLKIIATPFECPVFQPLFNKRDTQFLSKQESYYSSVVDLLATFLKENYDDINLNFTFNSIDLRPYNKASYNIDLRYTYILNLKDYDETNVLFDPAIKRQIKKANKNNYTLSTGVENDNIDAFYSLLTKTYNRQDLPLKYSRKQYQKLFRKLAEKGWFKLYVLNFNDVPASVMGITMFNGVAHYWLSASNSELYNMGGTSALIAEILSDLKKNNNITHFDFVGANTESIARFKAGFNFRLTPVYNIKYESNIVKYLFKIKRLLKR